MADDAFVGDRERTHTPPPEVGLEARDSAGAIAALRPAPSRALARSSASAQLLVFPCDHDAPMRSSVMPTTGAVR